MLTKTSRHERSASSEGGDMAKKTAPIMPPRLAGKKFAFAGKLGHVAGQDLADFAAALVRAEGGEVLDDLTADVDYMVVGSVRTSPSAAEMKAQTLNQNGAGIAILDESA